MKKITVLYVVALTCLSIFAACDRKTTIIREESVTPPPPKVELEIKGTDTGVSVEVDHK